ncbi:MAG: DUF3169 family protein [Acutalibacteraceae bacterium]
MNNNKVTADRKKNKTAAKKLSLLMIPGLIIGMLLGFLISVFEDSLFSLDAYALWEGFNKISFYATPVVYLVIFLTVVAVCLSLIKKARKIFEQWDGEDEETISRSEKLLSLSSSVNTVSVIVLYFVFGLWGCSLKFVISKGDIMSLVICGAFLLLIIISIVSFALISRSVIELAKKINPEKKGDALDVKFQKEWIDSCDEAEKMNIYKAGFKAYNVANYVCTVLWVLIALPGMTFDIGVLPLIIVTTIWLTLTLTYLITGYKLENKTKQKGKNNE